MTIIILLLLFSLLPLVFTDQTEVEIIPAVLIHEEHQYDIQRDPARFQNNNFRFNNNNNNNGFSNVNSNPVRDQPQFKPVPEVYNEKWSKPNENVEPPLRNPIEPLVSKFHPIDSRPPAGLKPPPSSNNRKNVGRNNRPIITSRLRSQSRRPTTPRSEFRPIDSRIPAGLQPPPPKLQDLQPSDINNDKTRKLQTYYPKTTEQPFLPMNLQNVNFYYPQTTIENILRPHLQNTYSDSFNRRPNLQPNYAPTNYPRPFQESNYPIRNQNSNRRPNMEPNYQRPNEEPNYQRPNNLPNYQRPNSERRPNSDQRPNLMPQKPNNSPYGPKYYLPNKPIKTDTTVSPEPLGVAALNHALITVLYDMQKTTRHIRNTNGLSTYNIFAAKFLETTTIGPPPYYKSMNDDKKLKNSPSRDRNRGKVGRTTAGSDFVTKATARSKNMVKIQVEASVPRVKYRQKTDENTQDRRRKNNSPRVISSQSFQIQN